MLRWRNHDRSKLLNAFFESYRGVPFGLRLWDGWCWSVAGAGHPECILVFDSPAGLEALLVQSSELALGEAFLAGEFDVEGDIFSAFEVAQYAFGHSKGGRRKLVQALTRLTLAAIDWLKNGPAHSIERDSAAISHHYDQPTAFFRPWLGDGLVYSCAYFNSPDDDLATAQKNKLELICRKLRLRHDNRFLDIGCGWGSLVLHAALWHNVYAEGITISREQEAIAAARIDAAQLTQSCRVDLMDYRLVSNHFAPFDKIASVGMFEHVGVNRLTDYFRTVHSMLRPGGVFLNHGIALAPSEGATGVIGLIERTFNRLPIWRRAQRSSFIDKYVFPDGELCTLAEATAAAEKAGFEVRDVENLREHYELTLRAWVRNLQQCKRQIVSKFSDRTYRIWLLYMAGSAAAFQRGEIAVYQTLMCRRDSGGSSLPLTRHDWYQVEEEDPSAYSEEQIFHAHQK